MIDLLGKTWVSTAPYLRKKQDPLGGNLFIYTRAAKALLQIPSVSQTKKLPGVVLFHQNMRGRFTSVIQQPFAVQDVEFTVVGFDPDPADAGTKARLLSTSSQTAEWPCRLMPKAIHVTLHKNRSPWMYFLDLDDVSFYRFELYFYKFWWNLDFPRVSPFLVIDLCWGYLRWTHISPWG